MLLDHRFTGEADTEAAHEPPKMKPVTILECAGCRFGVGKDRNNLHLFCNAPVKLGASYCEDHHSVCCASVLRVYAPRTG